MAKSIYWQPIYTNWATLEDPTMQHPTSPVHQMIYERYATQEEINAAAEEAHGKQEEEQSAVSTDPSQTDRKCPFEEDTEEDKPAEKKPSVGPVLTLQEQQRVNEAREEGKKALENCRSISRTKEERKTCISKAKEEGLKALQKCRAISKTDQEKLTCGLEPIIEESAELNPEQPLLLVGQPTDMSAQKKYKHS